MKVAIIGAGFTGLSCAFTLIKLGAQVWVFEKEEKAGGLALGFKQRGWQWTLEEHYHHLFESDYKILNFAKEVGSPVIFTKPRTSVLVGNDIFQFDSPETVFQFPKLNVLDKFRMALALSFLKLNPFWLPLEKLRAKEFLPKLMGKKSYKMIWEPLLSSKFGTYKNSIPLSWFWARIKKRSPNLGYPEGGFQNLADRAVEKIEDLGGKFFFKTAVSNIDELKKFDKIIVTLPSFLFVKMVPDLPNDYKENLLKLRGLGALNLLLVLKKQFLPDNTYWLNVCNKSFPFLSIVEHTNFMDKKYYGGSHIVYVGNYLPINHPYFKLNKQDLLKIYSPYLKRLNPNYELSILNYELFSAPFAQPVPTLNYSKIVPPIETPIKNVFLANIQQIYPWDRGTNYAVELGEKVAKLVLRE